MPFNQAMINGGKAEKIKNKTRVKYLDLPVSFSGGSEWKLSISLRADRYRQTRINIYLT